ncbi:hypothetical protein RISK_000513 [Rhodopirellula islandica]|uniref:Uncharacterized protein n=1 Tax=Rhodopirellula islandica TaxID=595434 RepID=A0A0J1BLS5_RHOIS|nr:hypothetical protein RISK_000513 [Rhodopirellula islandica]
MVLTPLWAAQVLFLNFAPTGQPYASPGQRPGLYLSHRRSFTWVPETQGDAPREST